MDTPFYELLDPFLLLWSLITYAPKEKAEQQFFLKVAFSLPFNRQENQFERIGVDISKATMAK